MMDSKDGKLIRCEVCHGDKPLDQVLPMELIRENIIRAIRQEHPDLAESGFICLSDINRYRAQYIQSIMEDQKGMLSEPEKDVIEAVEAREFISQDTAKKYEQTLSLGDRLADKLADFGGSWRFLGIFSLILICWIVVNSLFLVKSPFDPYPYIFLNLILSCLAAIQAPVIMMSQNRQEERDRIRAIHDYQVNLKAEVEIRALNEKLDRLIRHQWQKLLEIQQIQTDLMEENIKGGK